MNKKEKKPTKEAQAPLQKPMHSLFQKVGADKQSAQTLSEKKPSELSLPIKNVINASQQVIEDQDPDEVEMTSRAQVPVSIQTTNKKEKVADEQLDESPPDKFIRIDTKFMLPPKPSNKDARNMHGLRCLERSMKKRTSVKILHLKCDQREQEMAALKQKPTITKKS